MSQITRDQTIGRMAQLEAIYLDPNSTPWATETARTDLLMYSKIAKDLFNYTYQWPGAQIEPEDDEPYPSVSFGPETPNGGFQQLIETYQVRSPKEVPKTFVAEDFKAVIARTQANWQPPVQEQLPPPTFARDHMTAFVTDQVEATQIAAKIAMGQDASVFRTMIDNSALPPRRKPYVVPADAKVGVCICTHGSYPYVELGVAALRCNNPGIRILIHDDSSDQSDKLFRLASRENCGFVSTSSRREVAVGDASGFAEALRWGQREGLDIVVKCSRRFIIDKSFTDSLVELMHGTGYATATAPDATFGFGFRSELVAMAARPWIASGAINEIEECVRMNRMPDSLPEAWWHRLARKVHGWNNPITAETADPQHPNYNPLVGFESHYKRPDNYDGYALWPMMGLSRRAVMPGIIWHNNPNCDGAHEGDVDSYVKLSSEYNLGWMAKDFLHTPGE